MLVQLSGSYIPPSLSGPVLVDQHGLPRYWAIVWSTAVTGALADSTHVKKLRYIDKLYQHADTIRGNGALDDALGTLNDENLAEILESWFISIRNQTPTSASWLNQVERRFATLTEKQIRRGTHRSTRQLEAAIRTYVAHNNAEQKPFVWTKSADAIHASIERFCLRISNSPH